MKDNIKIIIVYLYASNCNEFTHVTKVLMNNGLLSIIKNTFKIYVYIRRQNDLNILFMSKM